MKVTVTLTASPNGLFTSSFILLDQLPKQTGTAQKRSGDVKLECCG